jgi:hypothetical protein
MVVGSGSEMIFFTVMTALLSKKKTVQRSGIRMIFNTGRMARLSNG